MSLWNWGLFYIFSTIFSLELSIMLQICVYHQSCTQHHISPIRHQHDRHHRRLQLSTNKSLPRHLYMLCTFCCCKWMGIYTACSFFCLPWFCKLRNNWIVVFEGLSTIWKWLADWNNKLGTYLKAAVEKLFSFVFIKCCCVHQMKKKEKSL